MSLRLGIFDFLSGKDCPCLQGQSLQSKNQLNRNFFERSALEVAPDLLGKVLVHKTGKGVISGKIVETEAYVGEEDLACHACNGKTKRNKVMYDRGGLIYIYLIYGIYYNFNIVTAKKHVPEAVLIRALEPAAGIDLTKKNLKKFGRVRADRDFMKGPGKLCAALGFDKSFYGEDITKSERVWVEQNPTPGVGFDIATSKRIGIDYADIYRDKSWRYSIRGNKFVSK